MSELKAVDWRDAWRAQLEAGLARTPLQPRGGDLWLPGLALVCLIVGLSLYLACGYHAGFIRLNDIAATYPSWVWQCLTVLGDERTAFALTLFFSLSYPRVFWTLIVAALIAIAYSRGFKELFDAMRPPAVLPAESFHLLGPGHERHSFPSGHSVTAAVFFGVLIYHSRWIELRVLWLLLAILVGLSRVAVGVHWPVDVAFGLMGGSLAAWLGGWLSARWPGPAANVALHLSFVLIAAALALTLLFDDAGYHEAAWMMRLIGLAALAVASWQYVARPLRRVGKGDQP
ncbi:phosphatase PAP2 family protein [Thiorhodococcus minor]|uniref:undecaprenyl-diphosphate phosphatase n=1 Tax=Thiorhodococcus minor TaxID=57489 RepID=A0A6M0K1C2_9GAMM|nr:phosphatase PAP2 family protein [Thiorhodococcus minor]